MDARSYRRQLSELREKHVQLVKKFVAKTETAIGKLDPAEASMGEVTNALRLISNTLGAASPAKQAEVVSANPLNKLRLVVGQKRTNKKGMA